MGNVLIPILYNPISWDIYVPSTSGITDQLNPQSRVFPEKLKKVTQLSWIQRVTALNRKDQWSSHMNPAHTLLISHFSRFTLALSSNLHRHLSSDLCPSNFSIKIPHIFVFSPLSLMKATCPTHILFEPLVVLGTECQLWSSKLCNSLQYLITSSLVCSNIHCSAWFLTTFAQVLHNWWGTQWRSG